VKQGACHRFRANKDPNSPVSPIKGAIMAPNTVFSCFYLMLVYKKQMKFLAITLFISAAAFAQTLTHETVHCKKGIFLSENNSVLDVALDQGSGTLAFGKMTKKKGLEAYLPEVKVVKSYSDPGRIELNDIYAGSIKAAKFNLVMKFKKLIDNQTIAYTGVASTDDKKIRNLTCTVTTHY
jgi:hypothetical protein